MRGLKAEGTVFWGGHSKTGGGRVVSNSRLDDTEAVCCGFEFVQLCLLTNLTSEPASLTRICFIAPSAQRGWRQANIDVCT